MLEVRQVHILRRSPYSAGPSSASIAQMTARQIEGLFHPVILIVERIWQLYQRPERRNMTSRHKLSFGHDINSLGRKQ